MDDVEDLDEEYASVKRLIANVANLKDEVAPAKKFCADEVTELGKLTWGEVTDW